MRFIDISLLQLPEGWQDRAERAFAEISELPPEERIKAINRRSKIWADLKETLENFSSGKCWYCETIQERSDNDVDHFRPKGRVVESEKHNGYWWLAFEWENYRFSCTYCNRKRKDLISGVTGGKHDCFPLLDENTRAQSPDDNIEDEEHCLLDPTIPTDPGLIFFDPGGEAVPYPKERNPRFFLRASISIKLYHLNFHKTRESRKILYNEVARLVRKGDRFFDLYAEGNKVAKDAMDEVMRRLMNMLDQRNEYSSATKDYLKGFRQSNRDWIEMILTRA